MYLRLFLTMVLASQRRLTKLSGWKGKNIFKHLLCSQNFKLRRLWREQVKGDACKGWCKGNGGVKARRVGSL